LDAGRVVVSQKSNSYPDLELHSPLYKGSSSWPPKPRHLQRLLLLLLMLVLPHATCRSK
jgi:hypothetical protein